MAKLNTYVRIETVKAIQITEANWKELSETIDNGDGCIKNEGDNPTHIFGDWLVIENDGNQIFPDSTFKQLFNLMKPLKKSGERK